MSMLFQPSDRVVSETVDEIADAGGLSTDADGRRRALIALKAAIKYYHGKVKWDWLRTEASPIAVVAPFNVACSGLSGQSSATAASGHGLLVDDWLQGTGIRTGTRISATASTAFGINTTWTAAITTVSANRDCYDLPSDFKSMYSVRMGERWLQPANRRIYDRSVLSPEAGTTVGYDMFLAGRIGKVRLLPSPNGTETLQLRYYRRLDIPTSVDATGTVDVPQDYDDYVVAWAKWHFLSDRDDTRERGATWLSLAQEGLAIMISDMRNQPDEEVRFVPGAAGGWPGVNDTRFLSLDEW